MSASENSELSGDGSENTKHSGLTTNPSDIMNLNEAMDDLSYMKSQGSSVCDLIGAVDAHETTEALEKSENS